MKFWNSFSSEFIWFAGFFVYTFDVNINKPFKRIERWIYSLTLSPIFLNRILISTRLSPKSHANHNSTCCQVAFWLLILNSNEVLKIILKFYRNLIFNLYNSTNLHVRGLKMRKEHFFWPQMFLSQIEE